MRWLATTVVQSIPSTNFGRFAASVASNLPRRAAKVAARSPPWEGGSTHKPHQPLVSSRQSVVHIAVDGLVAAPMTTSAGARRGELTSRWRSEGGDILGSPLRLGQVLGIVTIDSSSK